MDRGCAFQHLVTMGLLLAGDVLLVLLLVWDGVLSLDLGGVHPDDAGHLGELTGDNDLLLLVELATLELSGCSRTGAYCARS